MILLTKFILFFNFPDVISEVDGVVYPILTRGAAFIISKGGLLETSAHLVCTLSIEGKFKLADVSLHSLGRKYSWNVKLEVVAIDTSSDLAILQLPADMVEGLKFFKLGSGCRAGERILYWTPPSWYIRCPCV